MTPLLAALAGYLALQLAIGWWASRRVASEDDYLVAGRRLGYPLATFSIFATWFGAETCIGAAGRAHREGASLAREPFGYGLCLLAMGLFYAAPLWRRGLTTFADLFGKRYSPTVERTAAVLLVPGSVLWAAAQVRGFGHVLAEASGLALPHAFPLAAAICILYTVFGGLLADAVTDLVQGAVLVVGLAVVLVAVVLRLGGPGGRGGGVHRVRRRARRVARGGAAPRDAGGVGDPGVRVGARDRARLADPRRAVAGRRARAALGGGALYLAVGLVPVFAGVVAGRMGIAPADAEQVLPAVAAAVLPGAAYAIFAGRSSPRSSPPWTRPSSSPPGSSRTTCSCRRSASPSDGADAPSSRPSSARGA